MKLLRQIIESHLEALLAANALNMECGLRFAAAEI